MADTATTNYELVVVFPGSLKPSILKVALEKIEKNTAKLGKISNKAIWESHPLAYKIKQETKGTYFIAQFDAAPSAMADFEEALRLDPEVMRHFIMKTPKSYKWTEYSAEDLEHDPRVAAADVFAEPVRKTFAKKSAPKQED